MLQQIANAYAELPIVGVAPLEAWDRLAQATNATYRRILESGINIVGDDRPVYRNADDIAWDVLVNRQLYVMTSHLEHPVWTPYQNFQFRAVHDIVGHLAARLDGRPADFDWIGEVNAWQFHEQTVEDTLARRALFTEAIGQAAYALDRGEFGPQKLVFLPQYMQHAL